MSDTMSANAHPRGSLQPHNGTTVLVLGILGLVVCTICGIIAWVMGSRDLKEMDEGRMDPTGRQMTQAGKICGMIATILGAVAIGILLIALIIGLIVSASVGLHG